MIVYMLFLEKSNADIFIAMVSLYRRESFGQLGSGRMGQRHPVRRPGSDLTRSWCRADKFSDNGRVSVLKARRGHLSNGLSPDCH
jgi:hypothetical protein